MLTVLSAYKEKNKTLYSCLCECGVVKSVRSDHLLSKETVSCGCVRLKPPGVAALTKLYGEYRAAARGRKLEFRISIEEFGQIVQKACYFCNRPPRDFNPYINSDGTYNDKRLRLSTVTRSYIKASGIDRLDNARGYLLDNCVACCAKCNHSKRNYTAEEFVEHCLAVVKHQESIKEGDKNGTTHDNKDSSRTPTAT